MQSEREKEREERKTYKQRRTKRRNVRASRECVCEVGEAEGFRDKKTRTRARKTETEKAGGRDREGNWKQRKRAPDSWGNKLSETWIGKEQSVQKRAASKAYSTHVAVMCSEGQCCGVGSGMRQGHDYTAGFSRIQQAIDSGNRKEASDKVEETYTNQGKCF